tara:strand:+ start:3317 stop:4522 length:1206 start_codon:yes stop_codon:yes gene_type:complete
MNLLYFTTEDLSSGLFDNQVLGHLYSFLERDPSTKITLFVINKPSRYFKHKNKIAAIKKSINIIYIPLSPPMRFYTSAIFLNKAYILFLSILFRLFVNPQSYDVIHCRHYLPSLVCKKLRLSNIHFDVRSLSLFEYVQADKIMQGSKNYEYWENQEKELVIYAQGISVVSRSMIPYLKQTSDEKIVYCPIIANPDKIYFCADFRRSLRESWGWSSATIYVYSGSFGLYGINKNYLAKLIRLIIASDPSAKFAFLLSNSNSEFTDFLIDYEFDAGNFNWSSVSPDDLYKYLSAGDIGIHALPPQLDSFSRLGTKIVEYWCCGLPTLINNNVGEASDITKKYKFGRVVDLDHHVPDVRDFFDFSKFDRSYIREKSLQIFDKNIVLKNYQRSYQNIIIRNGTDV